LPFGCWPSLVGPSFPAEELCPSCVGPTGTAPDRNGVTTFRTEEVRPGRMPSILRGLGVRTGPHSVVTPSGPVSPRQPSLGSDLPLTEPCRWFTRVHPSGLPLARCNPYGSDPPWAFPLAMQPLVTY